MSFTVDSIEYPASMLFNSTLEFVLGVGSLGCACFCVCCFNVVGKIMEKFQHYTPLHDIEV